MSKHWEYTKVHDILQKLFVLAGPITLIPNEATIEPTKHNT